MTKNTYFGPNLAVFGSIILFFTGVSKSFGTRITPMHLVCIVFWSGIEPNGQKCQYLAKNGSFGPNLAFFIFYKRKQKTQRKTIYVPCLRCFLVGHGTKWVKNAIIFSQKCQGRFLAKKTFFGGRE